MEQLDQHHERILADLRGVIDGEVRCDDLWLQMYASDGSIYEIRPLGVVRPRSTDDVAACVQYAAEKEIPIHARGAGTGQAGESLGRGIILDFSKHLRRILHTDKESVRVQPGIVHERLNIHLQRQGRLFGPDPGNSQVTTIGSILANDGAGRHWLKYGFPHQHVLGLQVVLADGTILDVGREPLSNGASNDPNPRKRELVNRLVQMFRLNRKPIQQYHSKCAVNRTGYQLRDILSEETLDLARLLIGSEGTLALTTEVLLATQPLSHQGAVLFLFDSLEKAARTVQYLLPHHPTACDLMDRRHISLAKETDRRFHSLIPGPTEAVLLVEQEGKRANEVRESLQEMIEEIQRQRGLAFGSRQAFDQSEISLFRHLAVKVQPAFHRMKGRSRPVPFIEDAAIAPEMLPEFLVIVQNILKQHQVTATMFLHAGQGLLHTSPFLDLNDPADVRKMRLLADDYYRAVLQAEGSLGGERGSGLSRTPYIRQQYGDLYHIFRHIKEIFDPQNLFHPGKVVSQQPSNSSILGQRIATNGNSSSLRTFTPKQPSQGEVSDDRFLPQNLRPPIPPTAKSPGESTGEETKDSLELRDLVELQLNWEPEAVAEIANQCTGCGVCRSLAPEGRMCPVFRVMPAEEASPRAKANLIRSVITKQLDLSVLTGEEFKVVADLCVNCHMCVVECPTAVDIPKLMTLSKGAHLTANGTHLSEWILTRLDLVGSVASLFASLANWSIGSRPMRWLMEKTLGIAQGRKLPRVASRSFLRQAARRRLTKPIRREGRKVALFVDTYANWYDPQLASALVAVLEHNHVAVYVPPDQRQAGSAAISCGSLDLARRLAAHNVTILAEAVRQGYHIVTTEPAAASSLIQEYPYLLETEDASLVAENTSEACTYLWNMHTSGKLQLDLRPLHTSVGYHMPCRLRALEVGSPTEHLLRLIPGLSVHPIEAGCSGMAGTIGLKRENYRASLRAGWGVISRLRDPNLQAGTTECSACKMQMEQGTTKPTLHPLKILALSYGLMPEIITLFSSSGEDLIVS